MNPYVLAAIFGGVALMALAGTSAPRPSVDRGERGEMLEEIRRMVGHLESQFGPMPGLADFLVATAFRESNFNPRAQANTSSNAARGLYQMRPNSVFKAGWGTENLSDVGLIFDPVVATVFAVQHVADAARASMVRGEQRPATWAAVRRWWGYPSRVHDHGRDLEWSRASYDKFKKAIRDVDSAYGQTIPERLVDRTVDTSNYPGIEALAEALGVQGVLYA